MDLSPVVPEEKTWNKKQLTKFLLHMLNVLPTPYASQDSNRLTLIYFVVSALDLLGELEKVDKKRIIDYIYAHQVLPDKDDPEKNVQNCGFRGGSYFGNKYNSDCIPQSIHIHDHSHIAMTYTALAILRLCGDNFSKVNKKSITKAISTLQQQDGSFSPVAAGSESDMRFVYCAVVISYMLGDFSGINTDKVVNYIISSQSYDGAIGQGPGQESHGGSTYCAIAALHLLNRLHQLPKRDQLIRWCVERQISGFQGRINKDPDCCYSFWIGATLTLLDSYHLIDFNALKGFTLTCETSTGGFGKCPGTYPDVLHTYMALCGMSLGGESGIAKINCALGFNKAVADTFPPSK